jgi:hypothetical protein
MSAIGQAQADQERDYTFMFINRNKVTPNWDGKTRIFPNDGNNLAPIEEDFF